MLVGKERPIGEIAAQQAELPEVIGDILAHIGNSPIGADNHLGVLICLAFLDRLRIGPSHDPTALVLALRLEVKNARLLQLRKGQVPEFEVQNLALAGQKVVRNVETQHGFKVHAQNRGRDQLGDLRCIVAAGFDLVERGVAQGLALLVFFVAACVVPLRDARVHVPAEVIEALFARGWVR